MVNELSIILPCLNEEQSLGICIDKIKQISKQNNLNTEIIVVNNGSTDNSPSIAKQKQVILINEPNKGYGNAYHAGLNQATKENIIMVDCDMSYDTKDIPKFIKNLKNHDMVLGNRFANPDKSSMSPLNKFGNSILRQIFKLHSIYNQEVCTGFVGIKRNKIPKNLKSSGMEFSSEFLIKTKHLNSTEIPIKFHKRTGKSKLRRFRDGFRHVKFLLKELF